MTLDEFISCLSTLDGSNFNAWFLKIIPFIDKLKDHQDLILHESNIKQQFYDLWKRTPQNRHFYIEIKSETYEAKSKETYDIRPYVTISLDIKKLRNLKLEKLI